MSTTTLSPVAASLLPGRASSVSTFTVRIGVPLNGPARSAYVFVESRASGSWYRESRRLRVAVSRCVIVRRSHSESTPITGPVVVSVPISPRGATAAKRMTTRLSRTPGRLSASRYGEVYGLV